MYIWLVVELAHHEVGIFCNPVWPIYVLQNMSYIYSEFAGFLFMFCYVTKLKQKGSEKSGELL